MERRPILYFILLWLTKVSAGVQIIFLTPSYGQDHEFEAWKDIAEKVKSQQNLLKRLDVFKGYNMAKLVQESYHVPDITTIYHYKEPSEVNCYARTSALGLSFVQPDGEYRDSETVFDVPSCSMDPRKTCQWEASGWGAAADDDRIHIPPTPHPLPRIWILKESGGWMLSETFKMQPKPVSLCFFYSFYSTKYSSVHIYAKINSSVQELVDVLQPNSTMSAVKAASWLTREIKLELEAHSDIQFIIQGYKENPADIVALFGLRGCNPEMTEESAVMHVVEDQPERFICNVAINQFEASTASESDVHCPKCANGGVCEPTRNICLCRPGFVGTTCEHGCGWNLYGHDCSGHCSATWNGCRGMELCNPYVGCLCAPGYHGPQCMDDCSAGNYGSNCLQKCGKCRNEDPCDAYSGLCPDGCIKEYYPPYCRQYYAYLLDPPNVLDVKFTEATVSFSTEWSKIGGQGRPEFYRVEYYDVNMALTSESPMILQGQHVTHHLTGLNPGQFYQVRVVLIDFDGNSFTNSSVIPFANFTTLCLTPERPIYQLQAVSVDKNKFTLSWKYSSNDYVACPAESFRVYIADGSSTHMYGVTNSSYMVLDQNIFPYTKYAAWVQALTNVGTAPSSEHLDVLTKQAAPSTITKLAVKEATATKLVITWKAPNFPNGIIHHYDVTYRCLQYLACGRNVSCNESHGRLESSTTNITLTDLLPHAQYEVEVRACTIECGPSSSIVTASLSSRPDAAPEASKKAIVQKTPNSLMLAWEPVADCRKLNGYPGGYHIALYRKVDDTYKLVHGGFAITPPVKFYGLLPNRVYELHVRQLVTDKQYNPFHKLVITAQTAAKLTPVAQNITVGNVTSHSIDIKWQIEKPAPHKFLVSYKCVRILSCPMRDTQDCSSTISIATQVPQVTIKELHPYTRYIVFIKGVGDEPSEMAVSGFTTSAAAPGVSPVMALEPTKSRGVTWAEVQWAPPDDCTLLYGIFTGYKVEVIHGGEKILENKCNTLTHSMNFTDLKPYSEYEATVRVVVTAEDNHTEIISNEFLRIKFKTKAPAPGAVEELEVYGRGDNHLALRFKTPDYSYGTIDSVVIEYKDDYGIKGKVQMAASHCLLWPDLTCATITNLFPHAQYTVTVHAWCSGQKEKGAPATITASTIEEAPGPPAFVQVVNRTDTTFTVKWGFPTLLNGVFRGFLITYLQVSSAVPDLCCNDSGVLNISKAVETATYLTQISDLLPASGYLLEVRAVTIKPGEPLIYRDSTLPTTPQLKLKPEVIRESITSTTAVIEIKQQTNAGSPISAFFMAVHTPYEVDVGNFFNKSMQREFQELLGPKVYIVFELHPVDVELSFKVTLGTGARYTGKFGRFFNTPLDPDTTYRVEFLAMSEFADRRVYGRISSDTFHTRPFRDLRIPTGHSKSAYGHTKYTNTATVLDNLNKGIQENSEQENNELGMQSQDQCIYIIPRPIELSKSNIGETSNFNTDNSEPQLLGLASGKDEQVHGINKTVELQWERKDKIHSERHVLEQCRNSKSISIEYPKVLGSSLNKSQNSNYLKKRYQKIHFKPIKSNKTVGESSKNIRNITKG